MCGSKSTNRDLCASFPGRGGECNTLKPAPAVNIRMGPDSNLPDYTNDYTNIDNMKGKRFSFFCS